MLLQAFKGVNNIFCPTRPRMLMRGKVLMHVESVCLLSGKDEITIRSSAAEYLTYIASVGDQQDSIEMRYEDENIWLTQKMMATLYDVGTNTINYHIKKIFEDSEL